MKVELIRRCHPTSRSTADQLDADGYLAIGTIIEQPNAYALVQYGQAKPADEECEQKLVELGWQPHMLEPARQLQDKRQQGIVDAMAAGGDTVDINDLIEDTPEVNDDAGSTDE